MPKAPEAAPTPTYAFAYRDAPRPGNEINGLGETEPRRARQIFHGSGARRLEWEGLETLFSLICSFRVFWYNIENRWMFRHADGPVTLDRGARRREAADPAAMAAEIKATAKALGAGIVGITRVTGDALYEGYEPPFDTAVVLGVPHRREGMATIPDERSAREAMRAYNELSRVVIRVARHIRSLGWPARAYGESADILHIPLAVNAGLGQLGKHGSLICAEYGSSFRLATVLTSLPLATGGPVDIGVDDLCLGCRRCTIDCPPDAIVDAKQTVRGADKWYVDFDKCVPYFVKTQGCGICLEVCPWTEPGRGPALSEKLLAKRGRQGGPSKAARGGA